MKKLIGQVNSQERDTIQMLFERKSGLAELAKILTSDNEDLYEKLVKDLAETETSFRNWWSSMSVKYAWESADNGSWEIEFSDCNIYSNAGMIVLL